MDPRFLSEQIDPSKRRNDSKTARGASEIFATDMISLIHDLISLYSFLLEQRTGKENR